MSDATHLPKSAVATRNSTSDGGQLVAMLLLWAGPLTVFAMALFMAR